MPRANGFIDGGKFSSMELIFIIPIFLLAGISIYQDITTQKVRNWLIFLALVIGIGINQHTTIIQASLALTLGFTLYWFNLWAPGDAKLFTAYTILFPSSFFEYSFIDSFPVLAILLNAMVPASFYYLIQAFRHTPLKKQWIIFKELKHNYLVFIVLLFFIAEYAFSFFHIDKSLALLFEIIFIMTSLKLIEFNNNWLIGSIIAFIGCYELDSITRAPYVMIYSTITIFLSWIFKLSNVTFKKSKEIPFAVWMALGAILAILLKTDIVSYIKYL